MVQVLKRALFALGLSLYIALAGATVQVNDSGTWRTTTGIEVNDSGTWRTIQTIEVNDSGTWRLVYSAESITISDRTVSDLDTAPGSVFAGWELQSDGDVQTQEGAVSTDVGDWITPKVNMANYEVRATLSSGTNPTVGSDAMNTWLSLATSRNWLNQRNTVGTLTSVILVEIRRASDSVVMDSATITLSVDLES